MFGATDIIYNTKRQYHALVISMTAVVYFIDAEQFKTFITIEGGLGFLTNVYSQLT